jgi:hypothetical protein
VAWTFQTTIVGILVEGRHSTDLHLLIGGSISLQDRSCASQLVLHCVASLVQNFQGCCSSSI